MQENRQGEDQRSRRPRWTPPPPPPPPRGSSSNASTPPPPIPPPPMPPPPFGMVMPGSVAAPTCEATEETDVGIFTYSETHAHTCLHVPARAHFTQTFDMTLQPHRTGLRRHSVARSAALSRLRPRRARIVHMCLVQVRYIIGAFARHSNCTHVLICFFQLFFCIIGYEGDAGPQP